MIGVDVLAKKKIEYYFEEARKQLAALNVADERKQVLTDYMNDMMNRKK